MSALREREINNNLEQRLTEEQKLRGKKKFTKVSPIFISKNCQILFAFERENCKLTSFDGETKASNY